MLRRSPRVELEPVKPGDEEFVRQLARYWTELGIQPNPRWSAGYIERAFQEQGDKRHTCWATVDGRRVGFGMVRFDQDTFLPDQTVGYVCEFYVFPAERRRGVGTALARRLISFLRERGAVGIDLDVLPTNHTGMAFWRSIGFEVAYHHMRLR